MKNIKALSLIVMLMSAGVASAQYAQEKPNVEFMFKAEAGYLHNVGNYGDPTNNEGGPNAQGIGYNLNFAEEGMGLNLMAGINISQDFFLGGGLGYTLCAPMRPVRFDKSSNMALVFIDMDFRPVGDIWAPMVGARLGGSYLMNPNNYGNTISPYAEVYAGLNWFYDHALQQMDRNYHSLYVEAGIQLVQGTAFIPVRVGWRW
jgi:hypothetical protein